jgi:hypothetical protein
VLGSAALQKARTSRVVVADLERVIGRLARLLAPCVIAIEAVLALGLILMSTPALLVTGGFLLAATGFIALRLVVLPESGCACWGVQAPREYERHGELQSDAERLLTRDVLRPVWYAARNGILLGMAWIPLLPCPAGCELGIYWAITALPAAIIGSGLVAGIVRAHMLIQAEVHPLRSVFEPQLRPLVALSWYSSAFAPIGGSRLTGDANGKGLTASGSLAPSRPDPQPRTT